MHTLTLSARTFAIILLVVVGTCTKVAAQNWTAWAPVTDTLDNKVQISVLRDADADGFGSGYIKFRLFNTYDKPVSFVIKVYKDDGTFIQATITCLDKNRMTGNPNWRIYASRVKRAEIVELKLMERMTCL